MAWTPKLFGLLLFFFFGFEGCRSTNLSHASSGTKAYPKGNEVDITDSDCSPPYEPFGDYCLFIGNDTQGTWREMSDFCQDNDGDLVNLQDANILYEINQYIMLNELDDISYWVGATDEAQEGKWVWSSDNSTVRVGPPLWGHLFGYQPEGGRDQNCGVLFHRDFFYMHDESCEDSMYGAICQPTDFWALEPEDDLDINTKFDEPVNDCPPDYEKVGLTCIRVYPEQNYTWSDALNLCDGMNRHLLKIDDANLLGDIYDYFTEKDMLPFLWIGGTNAELDGGTDSDSEGEWVWHDATPVKLGTPFWESSSEGIQEPTNGKIQNCAELTAKDVYFGNDFCTFKKGVLCEYDL